MSRVSLDLSLLQKNAPSEGSVVILIDGEINYCPMSVWNDYVRRCDEVTEEEPADMPRIVRCQ